MKLVVTEHVDSIIEVETTSYQISIDTIDTYQRIPVSIGQMKGDIIAFRGPSDPVRVPSGSIAGRVLSVDPTTESGLAWIPSSGGSGSSVTLHNSTGTYVAGGTVVKISSDYDFVKATSADTSLLFVTAQDCDDDEDVVCYGVANTICSVQCTADAVAVGDELGVSSTNGVAEAVVSNGFAVALTAKASGSAGTVEAIIQQNGFLPLSGGQLTGALDLANVRIHANSSALDEDVAPGSTVYYAPYEFYDKDGNLIGHIEMYQDTNNKIGMNFGVRRKISGTWTWKQVLFSIDTSGNWTWNFGDATAARNALGASSGVFPLSVLDAEQKTVFETFSGTSVTAANRKVYNNGTAIASLTITYPAAAAGVIFEVDFSSGSSFSGVTFKNSGGTTISPKLIGDPLTFVSKRYNIVCWYDGSNYWACAKAG